MSSIVYSKDPLGIVTLTFDAPGEPVNTMNAAFQAEFIRAIAQLVAEKESIAGVILASAKNTFFAGGDLRALIAAQPSDAEAFFNSLQNTKAAMRQLETLGKPVVAAINGSALGGGLELVLSCHHRIAVTDAAIQLGFPEVTLGLLPGAGGVVKTVRIMGLQAALPLLTEGTRLNPTQALANGLIQQLVKDKSELNAAAVAWIQSNPQASQVWDNPKYEIPGGSASSPAMAGLLSVAPAMMIEKSRGNYPALEHILATMVESTQVDIDTALRIESRRFTELAVGQVSKNMIGTFFFQMNEVKAGKSRPNGIEKRKVTQVGIAGAGMMGAGIAWACASKGVPCILLDTDLTKAEQGKAYSSKILAKRVEKNRMTAQAAQAVLDLITPSTKIEDFSRCDCVIEAVFENRDVKASMTQKIDAVLAPDAIFCSNTSTLPISGLAKASSRPEQFIGLHFFSPVDKMALVEIIKGEQTSPSTVAHAYDFVMQLGKTPIVVNDGRGFYTSRVFGTYVNEGLALVGEGVPAALVENMGQQIGMPVGPLAVLDEVSLKLADDILHQELADLEAQLRAKPQPIVLNLKRQQTPEKAHGHDKDDHEHLHSQEHKHDHAHHDHAHDYSHDHSHDHGHSHDHDHAHDHRPHKHNVKSKRMPEPAVYVLEKMSHGYKRMGKADGAGFYEYTEQGKTLWSGLKTFERGGKAIAPSDIKDRLLYAQVIETCRCIGENLLSIRDANIGSIFGWGFPGYTGGTVQFVNHVGAAQFVARADQLATLYGERFTPPQWLREKAAQNQSI